MTYQTIKRIVLILGVLCLSFGLIPFIFGIHHAGCFLLILAGIAPLIIVGLGKLSSQKWRILQKLLALSLGIGGMAGLLLSIWMVNAAWFHPPLSGSSIPVLVLGCQVVDDQPSLMLRHRLDAALSYLKSHPEAPIVVSGGYGPQSDFSEAQVMASYLESHGIASHRIFLENRSHNTQENILFSTQLAQSNGFPPSFIVVTDSFHQLRSALYLRKYGFTPYSVPSQTPWGLLPGYWVREWLAILETLFLS